MSLYYEGKEVTISRVRNNGKLNLVDNDGNTYLSIPANLVIEREEASPAPVSDDFGITEIEIPTDLLDEIFPEDD